MNLEDVQPAVVDLLRTDSELSGIDVLVEDGTYPQTPGRAAALAKGLALVVWFPVSEGLQIVNRDGKAFETVSIHVIAEENQSVNRGPGGYGIEILKAVRLVLERISGKGEGSQGLNGFLPLDPPWNFFGRVDGVNRAVVGFRKLLIITPRN